MKTFVAQTVDQWRKWLEEHHDSESEVWLIFHKRHTGVESIEYLDALDEALCFGWVDSLIKRLDETRYARKFTPRKADSRWSTINRKRYAALKASGRLKPSGINRPPTDRSYGPRPRFQMPSTIPRYIQAAQGKIRRRGGTSRGWHPHNGDGMSAGSNPPSARRQKPNVCRRRFASLMQANRWDSSKLADCAPQLKAALCACFYFM